MTLTPALPYSHPQTKNEVQALIDSGATESLHLEFKASAALSNNKPDEISKDISAFANADGGLMLYGVVEKNHIADHIDTGVNGAVLSKEWLESKIQSNVAPRLTGLRISAIEVSAGMFIYAVSVPHSYTAPHQHRPSGRYYRRRNFSCDPMEDYEIRDARARILEHPPLINISIQVSQGSMLEFVIENRGPWPAEDVTFEFSEGFQWRDGKLPTALKNGMRIVSPGYRRGFMYGVGQEIGSGKIADEFTVTATYTDPGLHTRVERNFEIDLDSMKETLHQYSDLERHAQAMQKSIDKLSSELKGINKALNSLGHLAAPTGLNLSFSTLRRLAHMTGLPEPLLPKIDPETCAWEVFQEVLEIDPQKAVNLKGRFMQKAAEEAVRDIVRENPDLVEKLDKYFLLKGWAPASSE